MHANVQFRPPAASFRDWLHAHRSADWSERRFGLGIECIHLCAKIAVTFVLYTVLAGFIVVAGAIAGEPAEELETKSKFLVNFAQFTQWPSTAFASDKAPLIIGLLGTDPFGSHLDKLVENEVVRGHHIRVLRYRKVEEIRTCHILYISESEEPRLDRIVRALKGKPTLTVSEIEDSPMRGVMIRMRTEDKRVRLAINLDSAKTAHLILKSKLLRLGQIVQPAKK